MSLVRWLFGYGLPHTMALMRVLFGLLALISLLALLPNSVTFFSEVGLLPKPQLEQWQYRITVLNVLKGASPAQATMFVVMSAVVAALVVVGWKSRVVVPVLALCVLLLQNRNPLIMNSGDGLLRLMLIYLSFAPSGAVYSVDRWLIEKRARENGEEPPAVAETSLWPQRLMAIQIALLYLAATWFKWYGPSWRDGTAAWYPMNFPEFERFWVPSFLNTAQSAKAMTYTTLVVEFLLCTVVFYKPARKWILGAGLLFHFALDWRLNIPLFGPTAVACYLAFYEGDEVRDWIGKSVRRLSRGYAGRSGDAL